ncbi:N-acetylmuramoyl-L-alanine amidase [Actinoplanes sp. NPDC023801]|uniref:N-acetylmuramoyl-L-alanine amidase n=1 Tax=Actinoplanes sp. NPDC023801 TaxID=3154595 RepID=UPI0033E0BE9F
MQRKLAIGIGTAVAVLAAGGGVAVLTWPSGTTPAEAAPVVTPTELPPDSSPEPPRIRTELTSLDLTATGGRTEIAQRATKRFSLLGISWSDPAAEPDGTIEVRTRSVASGTWTGWQELEKSDTGPDGAEASRSGRRGATEPLWAGPSDGVAVRIAGKQNGLPAGLRLDLIDPGTEKTGGRGAGEPSPSASTGPSASPSPEPATAAPEGGEPIEGDGPVEDVTEEPVAEPTVTEETPAPVAEDPAAGADSVIQPVATAQATSTGPVPEPTSTVPVKAQFPGYFTRKAWSADETIVGSVTDAKVVNAVWVHHTGTTNDYECSESAAIVRSIQSNDVKVKGLADLGYNYMVDKCGRLFEGRRGGVENAIVPAATVGFNTGYAAIAVIGNFETEPSNAAIETILAQVGAARLGKYGFNPAGRATFAAGVANDKLPKGAKITVPRLAGHREADATVCPGAKLDARLPAIRARSQQMVTGMTLTKVAGGGYSGGAYYVKNAAWLTWAVANTATDIDRFEIHLDGKVVSTLPGTATGAKVNIPAGAHTVTVLAVHTAGTTARVGVTVHGDITAPAYRGVLPLDLTTGTYSTTAVPVRLGFTGTDNLKLAGYAVSRPRAANLGPVGSWNTTVKPGAATWTVTARDMAGNTRAASMSRTVVLSAETSARKSGTWSSRAGKSYLGGKALASTRKNAKLTYTFTGRSAALLFSRGTKTGKAYVYLDGRKVATIDTRSGATKYRQALWVSATSVKKHTVVVVVAGTSGRPTVVSDGLAYIR